ncbi:MAG: hypothetical protein RBU23_12820 [Candidatus Auribacterota bacterium]|jgi:hypothetical protein|nr:hypothetical protein [Candidatus Auribacterota bacterium]
MNSLVEKVATMRRLQKQYFKERTSFNLQAAKKAEKEVDDELEKIEQKEKQEPRLF